MAWILSDRRLRYKGFRSIFAQSQRNPVLLLVATCAGWQHRAVTKSKPVLDEVSKAIIAQLQQDGRRSYAAIAKEVGLSEAAVRQRVQRLIDGGVMQVVAVTDPTELGFERQAMIGIRATGELEPIAEALAELPEADYVVIAAGSFDLLVEVVSESDDHLLEILSTKIRTIPGVVTTETFVYLKLHKQTYAWGVR
jgi:Lrp/AsnC family transcriptional regulator for asnA, asnC and gidA